jgi:hypothetical protein
MPISFHDETTNTDILYIGDDGSVGLNCAAVGGVAVSIGGSSWITTDGRFPAGSCVSDSPVPLIGESDARVRELDFENLLVTLDGKGMQAARCPLQLRAAKSYVPPLPRNGSQAGWT